MNLTTDYNAFISVLQQANRFEDLDMFLTSGYVNFPPEVTDLLSSFKGKSSYLFAAPQANSFFHDPSFASIIPALYNIVGMVMVMVMKESVMDTMVLLWFLHTLE